MPSVKHQKSHLLLDILGEQEVQTSKTNEPWCKLFLLSRNIYEHRCTHKALLLQTEERRLSPEKVSV